MVTRPEMLRAKADEVRRQARTVSDPKIRSELIEAAEIYERLARQEEEGAARR